MRNLPQSWSLEAHARRADDMPKDTRHPCLGGWRAGRPEHRLRANKQRASGEQGSKTTHCDSEGTTRRRRSTRRATATWQSTAHDSDDSTRRAIHRESHLRPPRRTPVHVAHFTGTATTATTQHTPRRRRRRRLNITQRTQRRQGVKTTHRRDDGDDPTLLRSTKQLPWSHYIR